MADKYNVYASGIDYDRDSDGDWVRAAEHESEVQDLEEKLHHAEEEAKDFSNQVEALEEEVETLKGQLEIAKIENDRLRKALQDIIDS